MKLLRSLLLLPLLGGAVSARSLAQAPAALRVTPAEENLRAAAGGSAVATVLRGAPLAAGGAEGPWREVTLDAWVPAASVSRPGRGDTLVAAASAVLRSAPDGRPLARARDGMRLVERERRDGWVRVQRRGWIWGESVAPAPVAAAPPPDTAPPAAAPIRRGPAPGQTVLHGAPGGDTVAVLAPAAPVQVLERRGGWTRVRTEGWTRGAVREGAPAARATPAAVRADPEAFRGREVRWDARFLSLQRAEEIRTDFAPGEPYILARDPAGEPGFVYIAVPPAQLAAVRRLVPLQRFAFVARVRAGRSPLMGHPVLDLVSLRP